MKFSSSGSGPPIGTSNNGPGPSGSITQLYSVGGCQPAATHSRLTMTETTWLSRRATIVARPHAVRPMTRIPSLLQRKCLDHR